jgi:alkylhydroperoxidase family enzyme
MARIEPISREDMNEAQARVHDAAKAAGNPVGGPFTAYIRIPELYEKAQDMRTALGHAPLSERERQIVYLMVARHWNAGYPWFATA